MPLRAAKYIRPRQQILDCCRIAANLRLAIWQQIFWQQIFFTWGWRTLVTNLFFSKKVHAPACGKIYSSLATNIFYLGVADLDGDDPVLFSRKGVLGFYHSTVHLRFVTGQLD